MCIWGLSGAKMLIYAENLYHVKLITWLGIMHLVESYSPNETSRRKHLCPLCGISRADTRKNCGPPNNLPIKFGEGWVK